MMMSERKRVVNAVNERGWELMAHNCAQNDLLTDYAGNPVGEHDVRMARLSRRAMLLTNT
jgi:hypothetical protein